MHCDLLITNIRGIVQVRPPDLAKVSGAMMAELPVIENAFVAITGESITDFGSMESAEAWQPHQVIDAKGGYVFPSFVDSHTHLIFAASREEEFVLKIKGATYQEIASRGGGILNSARKLQNTSEEELFEKSLNRAKQIISTGTGAVEIKSGYGLTVQDELKMLRVARRIGEETPLIVKTTLLGAHAVPPGLTRDQYVDIVINEMIPAAAEDRLADYVDVFCEQGFFTVDDTERILMQGQRYGLKSRLHANQLHRSGGVQVGVKHGAVSVDHLENIGVEEIAVLKESDTMPTALPFAAFFLGLPFPPVRDLINAGLPVAIASDYNPGSSPSGNMSMMVSLACIKMKMTPEEAINAATLNTAFTLDLSASVGSITKGKLANLFITHPMPSIAFLPYAMGSTLIDKVILRGRLLS